MEDFRAHHRRARAHAEKGEIGLAVQALKQAIAVAPDEVVLYEDMFKWCLVAGAVGAALNAAFELRRLGPGNANYVYLHGIATLAAGQVPEARRIFEDALEKAPGSWEVRQALAQVLQALGENGRAKELLDEAVEAAPNQLGPANDLALIHLRSGEAPEAQRILRRVLGAHPDDPGTHLNLALALAGSNKDEAAGHARRALASDDQDVRGQAQRLLDTLG